MQANSLSPQATGNANVVADLRRNNAPPPNGTQPPEGFVPDTTPVMFSATGGTVNPTSSNLVNGQRMATFTGDGTNSQRNVCTTVDNQQVCSVAGPTGDEVDDLAQFRLFLPLVAR